MRSSWYCRVGCARATRARGSTPQLRVTEARMVWRNMPCLLIACGQRESGWRAGGWGRAGELARGVAGGASVLDKMAKWTRPRVTYRFVTPRSTAVLLCVCARLDLEGGSSIELERGSRALHPKAPGGAERSKRYPPSSALTINTLETFVRGRAKPARPPCRPRCNAPGGEELGSALLFGLSATSATPST